MLTPTNWSSRSTFSIAAGMRSRRSPETRWWCFFNNIIVTLHALANLRGAIVQVGDGGFLDMPELVTLEATAPGALVSTNGSGALSAPKLRAIRNVSFSATENSGLNLPLVETYLWDLCEGAAMFSAGTGATLNFAGLRSLTVANTGCSGLGYNVGPTAARRSIFPGCARRSCRPDTSCPSWRPIQVR